MLGKFNSHAIEDVLWKREEGDFPESQDNLKDSEQITTRLETLDSVQLVSKERQ